ncbi:MAG: alpha/beta hydrolase [Acetobacteraceae bacterium]
MLRRALLGAAVAASMSGCAASDVLNATVSADGVSVQREIAYAPGPRHGLDVYRPEQVSGKLPLVVFLYGGSWRTGDKAMYPFVARPLARRGAVVVVPDYRLYPEVAFPEFLDDNARAVAWAAAHAAALGADPARIFVLGHSAGAYNAAMLALDPRWLQRAGLAPNRLAGVIGLAGPYDFLPITDPDVIPVFAPVQDGPASQPITYVDGHNPPMLLAAGTDDTTVRPGNTERLAARIRAAGGPVEDTLYPGIGHIGAITAFAPLFADRAPVLDDVWAFIRRH